MVGGVLISSHSITGCALLRFHVENVLRQEKKQPVLGALQRCVWPRPTAAVGRLPRRCAMHR